jgi:hypothetical protein
MFKRFVSVLLFSSLYNSLFASELACDWNKELGKVDHHNIPKMMEICKSLPDIESEKDLHEVLKFYYDEAKKKDHPNRHQANKNLNKCLPSENSKVLVIAFEGTGAYEPLIPAVMGEFNKCMGGKVSNKVHSKIYSTVRKIYTDDKKKDSKWSGLQAGIMSEMISMKGSNTVDWYSFPSEEVEQLAGLEELQNISLKELYNNIKDSVDSNPKGIKNARDCIMQYVGKSKTIGLTPKIVIVSHSSGGRSLVKFTEHMKKDVGVDVDLAFSIDPVKEAHHAVEEVVPQKIGEPIRYAKWKLKGGKGKYPYSAVWSRKQPKKLYKSHNVKEHVNFYQLDDREGLKIGGDAMRFGIQGSPMDGAQNHHIKSLGTSGHGEVTYNSKVLKLFNEKLSHLLVD